jgi:hypothetical protein
MRLYFSGYAVAPLFERRVPVSVGFFLLRLALARPNGPPMPAREF